MQAHFFFLVQTPLLHITAVSGIYLRYGKGYADWYYFNRSGFIGDYYDNCAVAGLY